MHVLAVVRGSKITGADSSFEAAGSLICLNTRLAPDVDVLRTGSRWIDAAQLSAECPLWMAPASQELN
jgi:hypothetical protein